MKLFHKLNGKWSEVTSSNGGNGVGKDGKSAYEIAKEYGFEGSEEEWLNSLKGNPGVNGGNSPNVDYNNPVTLELTESTNGTTTLYTATATHNGLALCRFQSKTAVSNGYWFTQINNNETSHDEIGRAGRYSRILPVTKGDIIVFGFAPNNATSANLDNSGIVIYPYKEQNTYSTEEQIIGTWINGKPIYKKTFNEIIGPTVQNTWQDAVDVSSLNIDLVLNIYGSSFTGTDYYIPLGCSGQGGSIFVQAIYRLSSQTIQILSQANTNCTNYITMEYTKTTD